MPMAVDPHSCFADPDPTFFFLNADPDPASQNCSAGFNLVKPYDEFAVMINPPISTDH